MKNKIYLTLLSIVLVTCLTSSFTILETLDFTTEVFQNTDDRIDIVVTILSGKPEFTYSVWNKEPWENGREIESSGKTYMTQHTFRNLKTQTYFIMVSDVTGSKMVKQTQIAE